MFTRLITEFPDHPLTTEALMERLASNFNDQHYEQVILQASQVLSRPLTDRQLYQLYSMLGDTHIALESPTDAVYFYAMARQKAGPEERARVESKLKDAIRELPLAATGVLLRRLEDPATSGYLLYQLGLTEIEAKDYRAGITALAELIDRFPDHEYAPAAADLIAELKQNFIFRPHAVGCLLPLSGAYAPYGKRALRGVELALSVFNQRDDGAPVSLVIKDSGSSSTLAVQAVRDLFSEKVAAIVGPIAEAEAAAGEAQSFGLPMITLTQKKGVPEIGDFIFRNFITPQMQVETLLAYTVEHLGLGRFAILYPKEIYGETYLRLFSDQLVRIGGEITGVESYQPDQTDFAEPIKKLVGLDATSRRTSQRPQWSEPIGIDLKQIREKENIIGFDTNTSRRPQLPYAVREALKDMEPRAIVDFDAIFIPDSPKKVGLIIPQLAYHDVTDVRMLGTNLWHSQRLVDISGDYLHGALAPDGFFMESRNRSVREFVDIYQQIYQEPPGYIQAIAYDTAMIVFHIVTREHVEFRSDVRDALFALTDFPGVTGRTGFHETGEVRKQLYLLEFKNNRFVQVMPGPPMGAH
jgi:ABC-type branched-subunit amino acid transport system substrate-binding protein